MFALRLVLAIIGLIFVLSACDEDGPGSETSESLFPDATQEQQKACERKGGRWGPAKVDGFFVCYRDFSDANEPCQTSDQCQGQCLARSRTCTPVSPLYGCYEVISSGGFRQTVCVE